MIYRQHNEWQIWGTCHPAKVGCVNEKRPQCDCKYHVTNGKQIYSFEDWQDAEKKFCDLSKATKFVPGKTPL